MILPPFLKKGDRVAITAPARSVSRQEIVPAIETLRSWGLEVAEGEHLYSVYHQFAGGDRERASDLQRFLDDPSIRAVFCARGGYGTVRILDYLDFTNFCKNPKWIVGYSDITALHQLIHRQFGIATVHGTMPIHFSSPEKKTEPLESLQSLLFGKLSSMQFPVHPLNRPGQFSGRITGGNLSVIYSLRGTPYDIDTENAVLFLEDVDEYLYHIDRMMINLKKGGKLEHLRGLIVGGMTEIKDNLIPFGKDAYTIISEAVSKYNYPVVFGFPAGHLERNLAFPMGGMVEVAEKDEVITVQFFMQ